MRSETLETCYYKSSMETSPEQQCQETAGARKTLSPEMILRRFTSLNVIFGQSIGSTMADCLALEYANTARFPTFFTIALAKETGRQSIHLHKLSYNSSCFKIKRFFSNGKHDFGKTNSAHIIPVSFCVTLDSNSAFWEGYKKHKLNDSAQWHSP